MGGHWPRELLYQKLNQNIFKVYSPQRLEVNVSDKVSEPITVAQLMLVNTNN